MSAIDLKTVNNKLIEINSDFQRIGFLSLNESIELDLRIHRLALEVLHSDLSFSEKREVFSNALSLRSLLVTSTFPGALQLHSAQPPLSPALGCMVLGLPRVPFLGTYNYLNEATHTLALPSEARFFTPPEVQEKLSHIPPERIEYFLAQTSGEPLVRDEPPAVKIHPWAFPFAQNGANIKKDFLMGIVPLFGAERAHSPGSISTEELTPLEVYIHMHEEGDALLSPNNAHFALTANSPFTTMWVVAEDREEHRGVIACITALIDPHHPLCQALEGASSCRNLSDYLEHLQTLKGPIEELAARATLDHTQVPPAFQHLIFKGAWILKGSPLGVHDDFGRASYLRDPTLSPHHHASDTERNEAIQYAKNHLLEALILSPTQLLFNTQPVIKSPLVAKMMECAAAYANPDFKDDDTLFNELDESAQKATFQALWELEGYPEGEDYGGVTFFDPGYSKEKKARALLLGASRQPVMQEEELMRITTSLDFATLSKA